MESSAHDIHPDCDFCKIANGRDPEADVIVEADSWIAFFPLDPATPGHTLVIPRTHVANLWEVQAPLDSELMDACVRVGRAVQNALSPDGMNLITSAGKPAEQTVFHLHLHLVPRWEHDGFGPIWPVEGKFEMEDEEDVADRIRTAYSVQEDSK